MIDLHSHILPGVDDGAESFDDSLKMLRELEGQLTTDVVLTPHYVPGMYMRTAEQNYQLYLRLVERARAAGIKLNLYLGNEIYINDQLPELLRSGTIIPLNGSNYLLIELPLSGKYPHYEDIFKSLMDVGWKVILAHPERYVAAKDDFQMLKDLYHMGVLFQCDLGSLVGHYGKRAKATVERLAKDHMIFGFGSDLHRPHRRRWITNAQISLLKYYTPQELDQLLDYNGLLITQPGATA